MKLEGYKSFVMIESSFESLRSEKNELKNSFADLISVFLEENCISKQYARPLPPMLGNGWYIDLLKFYFVVKLKGGFDSISRKKLWNEVGFLYGLGVGIGAALKLIYLKYLDSLESWLVKLDSNEGVKSERFSTGVWSKGVVMAIGLEYSKFVSNVLNGLKDEKKAIFLVDLTGDENENENENENETENENELKGVVELTFADGEGFFGENHDGENIKQMKSDMIYSGFVSSDPSDDDKLVKGSENSLESEKYSNENEELIMNSSVMNEVSKGSENSIESKKCSNEDKELIMNSSVMNEVSKGSENSLESKKCSDEDKELIMNSSVMNEVSKGSENSLESKKCSNEDEELIMNSSVINEVSSLKRKRDGLSAMLEWVVTVSTDPVDPVVGTIPESVSWVAYGNNNCWKQALLAREALFVKHTKQLIDQKKKIMHPSMYDDDILGSSERPKPGQKLRVNKPGNPLSSNPSKPGRPRARFGARLDMQPSASIYTTRPLQRIPVSEDFQADVPEWKGEVIESDLKWLGSQIWPLEKSEDNLLILKDPIGKGSEDNLLIQKYPIRKGSEDNLLIQKDSIGKGRLDSCGCRFPGTTACVKLHVSKQRVNLKNELGSAFYAWKFDTMGEECRVFWTSEEENTFKLVIKENPFSEQKCFWERISEALPEKSWPEKVNYYFNVFVVERRALQNRFTPIDIDSDDDETEYGLATNAHKHRSESSASLRSWLKSNK